MGVVEDQKLHAMTTVQPGPSSTQDTKTVRMERGVLPFRKARSDEACRAFIRDKVVPALRNKPERMMNTRVLYPALGLDSGGRDSEGLKPTRSSEQFIGGGQSFAS